MKKTFLISIFALLLLSACSQGPGYQDIDYHKGTKGIELEFIDNSPPSVVYEGSQFPAAFLISNQGAFSFNESKHTAVMELNYDPFYFETIQGTGSPAWPYLILEGKSSQYPEGEAMEMFAPTFNTKPVKGQRESPSTSIFASVCYPYKTELVDEICIDTDAASQDQRDKVCELKDKTYSQGQGAPVAVTKLDIEMQRFGNFMRPSFLVRIKNSGSGTILAPVEEDRISVACEVQGDRREDWNKVKINAFLSGEELVCTPEIIRLSGEEGFSRCHLEQGGYGAYLNYYAPLEVELDYVYRSSISKVVEIERAGSAMLDPVEGEGCEDWQTKIGGVCTDNCELCASGRMDCGQIFESANWSCMSRSVIGSDFFEHGDCIQDMDFCARDEICCSKCSEVNSCSDYESKEWCNKNPCYEAGGCAWSPRSGGYCHVCGNYPEAGDCNEYEDQQTCESDPCQYRCRWSQDNDECESI